MNNAAARQTQGLEDPAICAIREGKMRGFTVALIGPDGAGKSTLAKNLAQHCPFPVSYLYMGVSVESSNISLPTTRLIASLKKKLGLYSRPPHIDPADLPAAPRSKMSWIRAPLRFANRSAEEWYRQFVAWSYVRQGKVVLFDRHFVFEYGPDSEYEGESSWDRLHRRCIDAFYPRPDLVLCLDAPADVLFSRCREYSVSYLEKRRQSFLRQRDRVANFITIDVTQPESLVEHRALSEIESFARRMRRDA